MRCAIGEIVLAAGLFSVCAASLAGGGGSCLAIYDTSSRRISFLPMDGYRYPGREMIVKVCPEQSVFYTITGTTDGRLVVRKRAEDGTEIKAFRLHQVRSVLSLRHGLSVSPDGERVVYYDEATRGLSVASLDTPEGSHRSLVSEVVESPVSISSLSWCRTDSIILLRATDEVRSGIPSGIVLIDPDSGAKSEDRVPLSFGARHAVRADGELVALVEGPLGSGVSVYSVRPMYRISRIPSSMIGGRVAAAYWVSDDMLAFAISEGGVAFCGAKDGIMTHMDMPAPPAGHLLGVAGDSVVLRRRGLLWQEYSSLYDMATQREDRIKAYINGQVYPLSATKIVMEVGF